MKKILVLLLCPLLLLGLAGCDRLVEEIAAEVIRQLEDSAADPSATQPADSDASAGSPAAAESEAVPDTDTPAESAPAQEPEPAPDGAAETDEPEITYISDAYEQWASLIGYWHAADGRYFILDMEDSHSAAFCEGVWDAGGGRGYGRVTQLAAAGEGILIAAVLYPAIGEDEMDGPQPETTVLLSVDATGREQDGKIHIAVNGADYQCAFAGMTGDEAYAVHLENISAG